jgi:glyoxylase-like metal-dependent hydrolase (beta-lactamase superfamily II)
METFKDPAKKHGLPDRTFKDTLTVLSGKDAIDLFYFGAAHTSGDAFVVFRNVRVLHAGDAFPGPQLPIMDGNNGGSGVSYPDTLAKAGKALLGKVDRVIPGHSAVTTPQAFRDYTEFITTFVNSITSAAKSGKTAEQALAEYKPAAKFASYATQRGKADVDLIYKEVQK